MPYIKISTTEKTDKAVLEEIKAEMGRAIALIPGKTESWLMVEIECECNMWLAGTSDGGCAMVDVHVFGALDGKYANAVTAKVTDVLGEKLGLAPDRIYVKYTEYDKWGWNGSNF